MNKKNSYRVVLAIEKDPIGTGILCTLTPLLAENSIDAKAQAIGLFDGAKIYRIQVLDCLLNGRSVGGEEA